MGALGRDDRVHVHGAAVALMHLGGMGAYAVLYGLLSATILFFVVAAFIGIHVPDANFAAALALLAIASCRSSASG